MLDLRARSEEQASSSSLPSSLVSLLTNHLSKSLRFAIILRYIIPILPTIEFYRWIGHGLHGGLTLAFLLWLSNFKTETRFGFLVKKAGVVFFQNVKK